MSDNNWAVSAPTAAKKKYTQIKTGIAAFDAPTRAYTPRPKFLNYDIPVVFPGQKRIVVGRILPAFDPQIITESPTGRADWIPYRVCADASTAQPDQLDERRQPKYTAFSTPMRGYRMFGPNKRDIVSPVTRSAYGVPPGDLSTLDPIAHIRQHVFNLSKQGGNGHLKAAYLDGGETTSAIIPKYRDWALFNMWGKGDYNDPNIDINFVCAIPLQGLEILLDSLSYPSTNGFSRDVNFPNYLYGDVTNPTTGLWTAAKQVQRPGAATTPFTFVFSKVPATLDAIMETPVTDAIMRARYDIFQEDAYHINTYQELVDMLVDDAHIPNEWIKAACSHAANVGDGPNAVNTHTAYSYPPPAAAPVALPTSYQTAAPVALPTAYKAPVALPVVQPAAPMAPPPRPQLAPTPPVAPKPPVQEERYWIAINNETLPEPKSESECMALTNLHGDSVQVANIRPGSEWAFGVNMPGWVAVKEAPALARPEVNAPAAFMESAPVYAAPISPALSVSPSKFTEEDKARLAELMANPAILTDGAVTLEYVALLQKSRSAQ